MSTVRRVVEDPDRPAERSPIYGLTRRETGKPVRIAASELSRAINTLNAHHGQEPAAFDAAASALVASVAASPRDAGIAEVARRGEQVDQTATRLRESREPLLERLLALREPLVDLLMEAQALLPSDATLTANVEPEHTPGPPEPISGLDLTPQDRLRVVAETYEWSRRISRGAAVQALGPCYLLSYVIENPTPASSRLRADVTEIRERLLEFIYSYA